MKLTHTTSSSAFSLSSFSKSSLLITVPPPLSLQPFIFQFLTQLVMPLEIKHINTLAMKQFALQ